MAVLLGYCNIAGFSIQSHRSDQLFVPLGQLLMSTNILVVPMVAQYICEMSVNVIATVLSQMTSHHCC